MAASVARTRVLHFMRNLQRDIVDALQSLDPQGPKFSEHSAKVSEQVSTTSYILQDTNIARFGAIQSAAPFAPLEKANVAFSLASHSMPSATGDGISGLQKSGVIVPPADSQFFGASLSTVIHPRSPHAPTCHANWRYFEVHDSAGRLQNWWFGGVADLTPAYVYEQDCREFHRTLKAACAKHGDYLYKPMKKWCDEYLYLPFRQEARGIGGIFFDNLSSHPHPRLDVNGPGTKRPTSAEECFQFFKSIGAAFLPSYMPILRRRAFMPWTEAERNWQLSRRGRYVEFNLIADEGTKFGINTRSAPVESVLLSLPETARWVYLSDNVPEWSREAELLKVLKVPQEWA
ncbi:coproporphyrinogen III oxidase [Ceratobasidium sp. AG-Ba]|nr:coproporphyrinogen III oxidase [Ceratobasidium sp. AG-Ba]